MAEIVPGLNLGLPEIDPYSTLQGINYAVSIIAVIIIIGIFFVIGMKKKWFFKFPVTFDILKVENGVLSTVDTDKGRRVLKKNRDGSIKELYYDIKHRNFKWYPPSFESSVATRKGRSKFYVREMYPNKWEIIDPKSFVTGNPEDYKRVEGDELDSYFKNTQDDVAEMKFKLPQSGWDKLLGAIGPMLPILVAGAIFIIISTQVLLPAMDKSNQIVAAIEQSNININASKDLLDRSTRYVELMLRLNGMNMTQVLEGG